MQWLKSRAMMNAMMNAVMRKTLEQAGLRATTQRIQIAQYLFSEEGHRHFTADELFNALQSQGIQISQATIYNSLNLFAAHGLIREVGIEGQKSFYDTNTQPHAHYFYEDTGNVVDAPENAVQFRLNDESIAPHSVKSVDIVVRISGQSLQNSPE